ncbi:BatD family protein [Edaphocola flava]|uniref:BatD family protein n=1 Tax=Edaphocola flava TaxID=2499629 RepID=UPI00100BFCA5|nr:BatD family protein [Edaphocola flava]
MYWCKYKRVFAGLMLLLLSSINAVAQGTTVSAQVSSNTVGVQEQFLLTITISNPTERFTFLEPSLRDFRVLDGPGESYSNNVVTINGHTTQENMVSYTYVLQPLRQGTFTIGSAGIRTQRGQEMRTSPVRILVASQGSRRQQMLQQSFGEEEEPRQELPSVDVAGLTEAHLKDNIFIRAEVDNKNPYLGQQINVVYKLYTRLRMSLSPTSLPVLNGFWSQDQQREPDMNPVQENFNGKRYNVFVLRKTALFPQQSGLLRLDPAKAEGMVEVAAAVGGNRYIPQTIQAEIESPAVDIDVKPLPAGKPADFSGGVGQFVLSASLSRSSMSTDDVAQLVLTINGSGNIGLINAPVLNLPSGLHTTDPESRDSISDLMPKLLGSRKFLYQISADSAGNYTIAPIQISYFDIGSGTYKTLQTGSFTLSVSQGTKTAGSQGSGVEQMKDIHGPVSQMPAFKDKHTLLWQQPYYWLLYIAVLIGFGFLAVQHRRKQHRLQHADVFRSRQANKEAWKRLAAARNALQHSSNTIFYEEVSKAIWLYLSDKLAMPISSLSKENIVQKLRFRGIAEEQVQKTLALITECEMALYSPEGGQQQRQATLDEAGNLIGIYETYFKKK